MNPLDRSPVHPPKITQRQAPASPGDRRHGQRVNAGSDVSQRAARRLSAWPTTASAMRDALGTSSSRSSAASYPLVIDGERGRKQLATRRAQSCRSAADRSAAWRWAKPRHVELAVRAARAAQPAWARCRRSPAGRLSARPRPKCCAAAGSSWPPGRSSSAASSGARPTPTSARRSTSASTTPLARLHSTQPHDVDVPGEENRFVYVPRGVTAVIAPWNFPLAILTGMTDRRAGHRQHGGHEAGRAVARHRRQADGDLPRGRPAAGRGSTICPGRGEVVGAALVEHPDVALIAFTGSRAVGLAINTRAAEVSAAGIAATSSA